MKSKQKKRKWWNVFYLIEYIELTGEVIIEGGGGTKRKGS